jgi:HSP20 family protein
MLFDALTETGPFDRFWDLRREFDRLFDEVAPYGGRSGRTFAPAFEAEETEGGVTLRMDVPGVPPEALNVSVNGRMLSVEGERAVPDRDEKGTLHRNERAFGRFSRSVQLPDQYDVEAVEAKHENGILTIHIPKSAAAKPRAIKIEAH